MPGLFSSNEVAALNQAAVGLLQGEDRADGMHRERERSGAIRQVYLAHRYSPPFKAAAENPKIVEPVKQILQAEV